MSNYATKTDLKNVTQVDVTSFALKTNLSSLKTEVDKIDVGKSNTVPVDLAKLSNVVKNDVVKKAEYDKLVTKLDKIDTTRFVLKTKYDTDKSDLEKKLSDAEKKISNTSDLAKKTDLNAKITEIEKKIPSITGLATNSALTAVEDKIANVSNLDTKSTVNNFDPTLQNCLLGAVKLTKNSDIDKYQYSKDLIQKELLLIQVGELV